MVRRWLIMGIFLFLSGCVGGGPSYPDWFSEAPLDNDRYIYGMKEGSNKEEAISRALNEIASKIHVSVESSSSLNVNIKTTNDDEVYTKDSTQEIKNHVQKIEFSNYRVKQEKKLSDERYVVLVEVDKELNAKLLLERIDTEISKYNQLLNGDHSNPISTVKEYHKAIDQIKKCDLVDGSVVKSFNPASSVEDRIAKLLQIKKAMEQYQSNILFGVTGNNKAYQDVLVKQIASKGFKTTEGQANITIEMQAQEKELKVLGNKILKSSIQMVVKSGGNIIGQSRISVGAKSRSSYDQAREFALRNFERRLKEEKIIENLLGV